MEETNHSKVFMVDGLMMTTTMTTRMTLRRPFHHNHSDVMLLNSQHLIILASSVMHVVKILKYFNDQ